MIAHCGGRLSRTRGSQQRPDLSIRRQQIVVTANNRNRQDSASAALIVKVIFFFYTHMPLLLQRISKSVYLFVQSILIHGLYDSPKSVVLSSFMHGLLVNILNVIMVYCGSLWQFQSLLMNYKYNSTDSEHKDLYW